MATWAKQKLPRENGELVDMQVPILVSASRSTDIPAFYADWFFYRLDKAGYSAWTNPFNGVKSYVSYKDTRFIVFWSKNPKPLLRHLPILKQRGIGCYIQYSLNDYEEEGLEKNVPPIEQRIETFKQLTNALGKGHVIWRFDPLVLTDSINIDKLLDKVENIGNQLLGYTEKLVFSFADILSYRKVQANLQKANINYIDWQENQMREFARRLSVLNQKLMDYLKVKFYPMPQKSLFGDSESLPDSAIILPNGMYALHGDNKDKGQRAFCGCIKSKDIGEYNTCVHGCEYCYANASKQAAVMNYKCHKENPWSETIT